MGKTCKTSFTPVFAHPVYLDPPQACFCRIIANQAYTLKLTVTGSNPVNLEVSLNGSLLLSFSDASASRILSGVPGIENDDSGVRYDRFTVTGP